MKQVKTVFLNDAMVKGTGYSKKAIETIDKEDFDRLEELGLAREYDVEIDEALSEDIDTSALEDKVETLTNEKTALEDKVETLTNEKTALEDKIVKLNAFVEEAINLSKGQKPQGYEKAV